MRRKIARRFHVKLPRLDGASLEASVENRDLFRVLMRARSFEYDPVREELLVWLDPEPIVVDGVAAEMAAAKADHKRRLARRAIQ